MRARGPRAAPAARPIFHRLPPPTDADIMALLTRRHRRVRWLLARRGRLGEEDPGGDPFAVEEPLFASAVGASLEGRVALGPRAGQPVRRLRSAATATSTGPRCARLEGFSLHADVAVPARHRDRLEHLVRSVLRPPLALERLTESSDGQLLYPFRRSWSDGPTALLSEPLELLERLAALAPPPRRPLLADHGVVAPHASWRVAIEQHVEHALAIAHRGYVLESGRTVLEGRSVDLPPNGVAFRHRRRGQP
jgi:hypothetical protein